MSDKRTPFEKFRDLATALVQVPKDAVDAQPKAARTPVKQKTTKRPKAGS